MSRILQILSSLWVVLLLGACESVPVIDDVFNGGKQVDYKTSKSLPPLEIPPDLTMSGEDDSMSVPELARAGTTTYSQYANREPAVDDKAELLSGNDVRIERDGDKRWMVVRGSPGAVWAKVREFWLDAGFLLATEDPRIGIMETDWAENRADIPQGPIRRILSKVMDSVYSASTRDRFRTRLERGGEPGTTEIYLIHRGAEEVAQGEDFVWQSRPADPELEAEMLRRMMVYFGIEERRARSLLAGARDGRPRAQLIREPDGKSFLLLDESYSRAWRRTAHALDRVGFTVEDRDRSRGIFYVRYVDPIHDVDKPRGWLSKLAFWSGDDEPESDDYLIRLQGDGDASRIEVLDTEGKPEQGKTAGRILSLLYDELK